ncbi:hypothetical protein [Aurantimonas sp. VKM B-3413]|uniref:hypothetical protein n=1 Tax=Aurantimonas sp. VKM B-3413 TaxID=2779401 RepID=UPI001E602BA6|nr:hypothetical protein [Aurantimonas sp. VKM B-3413]MCB8836062.1 hypothetical protein [Aurantimonas sp. VKM B-3413]
MARIDFETFENAETNGAHFVEGEILFELGMRAASGRDGAADLVAAHMYFNLADRKGYVEAAFHRQDVASQLSKAEISRALRSARDWLTRH